MLADAGVIEEDVDRSRGRERWWRLIPVDHREPDYGSLEPRERAALDAWRAAQIPGEVALFGRFLQEFRQHGNWAKASRTSAYFTAEGLDAFMDEYVDLIHKMSYDQHDAPSDARAMQDVCSSSR